MEALNKAGYSCAGIDNRGCGRSNGLFGYVNDHRDWVQDVVGGRLLCSSLLHGFMLAVASM